MRHMVFLGGQKKKFVLVTFVHGNKLMTPLKEYKYLILLKGILEQKNLELLDFEI